MEGIEEQSQRLRREAVEAMRSDARYHAPDPVPVPDPLPAPAGPEVVADGVLGTLSAYLAERAEVDAFEEALAAELERHEDEARPVLLDQVRAGIWA